MASGETSVLEQLFEAADEARLPVSVARELGSWVVRLGGVVISSPRLSRAVAETLNFYTGGQMGTHLTPDDDPQEVACTVPADYEPDPDTLKLLAGRPDDEGGDS